MDPIDLPSLFSELVRLETELWNAVDKRLRETHGLPLSRFEPMQVIDRTPDCRVNDIVQALSITVGGASKLVDRIEAAGLCCRRQNPGDGRSSLIELTPAGKSLLSEASQTFSDELGRRIGRTVPPQVLQQFAETIRRLKLEIEAQDDRRR